MKAINDMTIKELNRYRLRLLDRNGKLSDLMKPHQSKLDKLRYERNMIGKAISYIQQRKEELVEELIKGGE
jgi:hypothetical protein